MNKIAIILAFIFFVKGCLSMDKGDNSGAINIVLSTCCALLMFM